MMQKSQLLKAPLTHAKRQFHQDCLYVCRGAIFLLTPELLTTVSSLLNFKSGQGILLDSCGDPVYVDSSRLLELESKGAKQFEEATDKYLRARELAETQFISLLDVQKTPDEETE